MNAAPGVRFDNWAQRLVRERQRLVGASGIQVEGVLDRMVGLTLEATGCSVEVGGRCRVECSDGGHVDTEVVGFSGDRLFLMPTGDVRGIRPGARVLPRPGSTEVPAGASLLGRVLDGAGNPLDGLGPLNASHTVPLTGKPINPLSRNPISDPLDVGVRSINGLLTVGRGQRIGLFAGSGVGKSVLLGMMTRFTNADVVIVGLIGERGREVKEFVDHTLGPDGMRRAVVIATPADNSPLMRMHGAWLATALAEHFRDQGLNVLLLMDSLTRFAQAQREIALAIGEPPATKGYSPSVFAKLPQLIERAGNAEEGSGSITAFYTVLVEGDDHNDPIADSARAILDGHIVLSRKMGEAGIYPAIDVEASISRLVPVLASPEHRAQILRFRHMYSTYMENKDLISVGAYSPGSDRRIDEAIEYWPRILRFLQQDMNESVNFQQSLKQINELMGAPAAAQPGSES